MQNLETFHCVGLLFDKCNVYLFAIQIIKGTKRCSILDVMKEMGRAEKVAVRLKTVNVMFNVNAYTHFEYQTNRIKSAIVLECGCITMPKWNYRSSGKPRTRRTATDPLYVVFKTVERAGGSIGQMPRIILVSQFFICSMPGFPAYFTVRCFL